MLKSLVSNGRQSCRGRAVLVAPKAWYSDSLKESMPTKSWFGLILGSHLHSCLANWFSFEPNLAMLVLWMLFSLAEWLLQKVYDGNSSSFDKIRNSKETHHTGHRILADMHFFPSRNQEADLEPEVDQWKTINNEKNRLKTHVADQ